MPDQIRSIDDLEEVRAAAAAQGASVTNYNEWYQIMQQLEELGVESTGSYAVTRLKLKKFSNRLTIISERRRLSRRRKKDAKNPSRLKRFQKLTVNKLLRQMLQTLQVHS